MGGIVTCDALLAYDGSLRGRANARDGVGDRPGRLTRDGGDERLNCDDEDVSGLPHARQPGKGRSPVIML